MIKKKNNRSNARSKGAMKMDEYVKKKFKYIFIIE